MATGWQWLVENINQRKYEKVAELGVQNGENSMRLLGNCPGIKEFLAVDLWKPQPENKGPQNWVGWAHNSNYYKTKKRLKAFEDRVTIHIVKDYTYNVVHKFPDGYFDLIFMDADPGYESCKRDILDWLPKVRTGGVLCGHDADWPTVRKAVEDVFRPGRYDIVKYQGVDRIWYVEVDEGLLLHVKSSLEYHEVVGTINEEADGDIGSVPKNGE